MRAYLWCFDREAGDAVKTAADEKAKREAGGAAEEGTDVVDGDEASEVSRPSEQENGDVVVRPLHNH